MRITTERLTLREFTMDDVQSLYALESIPEVVRYQEYPPRSLSEAGRVVREIVQGQKDAPRRHMELAVILDGAFIGRVGAWIVGIRATLWYAFMPAAQGQGFASEAVRAFVPFVGAQQFTIECDPRNEASWRLAERLGFVRESFKERAFKVKGEWVGSFIYGLKRPPSSDPNGPAAPSPR